jgi:hypothetical protein
MGEFAGGNRTIFKEANMAMLIEMPVAIYQAFLGRYI